MERVQVPPALPHQGAERPHVAPCALQEIGFRGVRGVWDGSGVRHPWVQPQPHFSTVVSDQDSQSSSPGLPLCEMGQLLCLHPLVALGIQ